MQPAKAAESDPTTSVVPEVRPNAPWRVASVEALAGARLKVTFVDGTAGQVEMQGFLDATGTDGTIFEPPRDPQLFRQARVELGVVAWPNGADLAPDAMYDAIRSRGVWTLS